MKLELPYFRSELISYLDSLRNREVQLKEWVNPQYLHAFWDSLRFPLEFIFSDLGFDFVIEGEEEQNFQEGATLFNEEETKAVMKVVWALQKLYDEIGGKQPDSSYIHSPLWDEVVKASQEAYNLLVQNNEKYHFSLEEES